MGNRIKVVRERLSWGQAELARAAGISPNALWRIENGLSKGRPATFRKIAEVLGVSPQELRGNEDDEEGEAAHLTNEKPSSLSRALSMLQAFLANLPQMVREEHVAEYNRLVGVIEEASMLKLDEFRVPREWLKPVSTTHDVFTGRVRHSDLLYVDKPLFMSRLDGVLIEFNLRPTKSQAN